MNAEKLPARTDFWVNEEEFVLKKSLGACCFRGKMYYLCSPEKKHAMGSFFKRLVDRKIA
jgi:hypothetical protein